MPQIGRLVIILGAAMVLLGVALMFFDRLPLIGRLPGDIHVRRGNFTFYFPLATSLVLSVVLTLLFSLFAWLARR